jgi:hypothetical protein
LTYGTWIQLASATPPYFARTSAGILNTEHFIDIALKLLTILSISLYPAILNTFRKKLRGEVSGEQLAPFVDGLHGASLFKNAG